MIHPKHSPKLPHNHQHLTHVFRRAHYRIAKLTLKELKKLYAHSPKLLREELEKRIRELHEQYESKSAANFDRFIRTFTSFPHKQQVKYTKEIIGVHANELNRLNAIRENTVENIVRMAQLEARLAELQKFESNLSEFGKAETVEELKAMLKRKRIGFN